MTELEQKISECTLIIFRVVLQYHPRRETTLIVDNMKENSPLDRIVAMRASYIARDEMQPEKSKQSLRRRFCKTWTLNRFNHFHTETVTGRNHSSHTNPFGCILTIAKCPTHLFYEIRWFDKMDKSGQERLSDWPLTAHRLPILCTHIWSTQPLNAVSLTFENSVWLCAALATPKTRDGKPQGPQ